MNTKLPESREKEIFRELLEFPNNDAGNARAVVAERRGIPLDLVKAIERKGIAQDWPPLD